MRHEPTNSGRSTCNDNTPAPQRIHYEEGNTIPVDANQSARDMTDPSYEFYADWTVNYFTFFLAAASFICLLWSAILLLWSMDRGVMARSACLPRIPVSSRERAHCQAGHLTVQPY